MVKPALFRASRGEREMIRTMARAAWPTQLIAHVMSRDPRTVKRHAAEAAPARPKKRAKMTPQERKVAARRRKAAALAAQTVEKNGKKRPKFATAGAIAKEMRRLGIAGRPP